MPTPKSLSSDYQPMMSADRIDQLAELHTLISTPAEGAPALQTVPYLGLTLDVPLDVMVPCQVSPLFSGAILSETKPGDRVLDMGTGSGSHALIAAGKAKNVLAVDINENAVTATSANAERNGLASQVQVRVSDIFESVDGEFDLIIFNPPFQWFPARDTAARATTDENYEALRRFLGQAKDYLAPEGRIMLFFSTAGDVEYLKKLIDANGFASEEVFAHRGDFAGMRAEYFTFKLTAP